MQFIVIGRDGSDSKAPARRQAVRDAHIALGDQLFATGQLLDGAAILDDAGQMIGSCLFCEFESREALDAWLEMEPYVIGNVWQEIEIMPCQIGPSFSAMHKAVR